MVFSNKKYYTLFKKNRFVLFCKINVTFVKKIEIYTEAVLVLIKKAMWAEKGAVGTIRNLLLLFTYVFLWKPHLSI